MIKIVNIKGGLGNQMFGYAFFLSLKQQFGNTLFLLDVESSVNRHNGLELFKIFSLQDKWRVNIYRLLDHRSIKNILSIHTVVQENALKYEAQIMNYSQKNLYFDGYWQSESFFKQIELLVREKFRFRKRLINDDTARYANQMLVQNSVSIHVRRGDYLKENGWNISEDDYYDTSIEYIKNRIYNPFFYIFSDDIEWCKTHFKGDNYYFVDCNIGMDDWQDMYLMSQCKHNIIANSTFSWWGAWLNNDPNKIVIAPHNWLPIGGQIDIIPKEWIKI